MKNPNTTSIPGKNPPPADRLLKTQLPKNNSNKGAVQRPQSSKSGKPSLKPQPVKKVYYPIEENMTESRICHAKQGLQLLKKKMSKHSSSRQKVYTNVPSKQLQSLKEYKQPQKQYEKLQEQGIKPKIKESNLEKDSRSNKVQKTNKEVMVNKIDPRLNKQSWANKQSKASKESTTGIGVQIGKKQQKEESQQRNISNNNDFMQILERQLKKEQIAAANIYQSPNDEELIQCSHGCGRMFNITAIQKHQKICQKVFQSKRKAFNSAAFRKLEQQEGFKQTVPQQKSKKQKNSKGLPQWKVQSLKFRAALKEITKKQLTEEEKKAVNQGFIHCKFCGRKFNQKAGQRHVAFCQQKSKEMPRMNTKK